MRKALSTAPGVRAADFRVVSSESVLPIEAHQVGSTAKQQPYLVLGVDAAFLSNTTYKLAATAKGYGSAASVWKALRTKPNLAVVDSLVVPRS